MVRDESSLTRLLSSSADAYLPSSSAFMKNFRFLVPDDGFESWIYRAVGGSAYPLPTSPSSDIFRFLIPEDGKDMHKCTAG
jgi:hypothetical protein